MIFFFHESHSAVCVRRHHDLTEPSVCGIHLALDVRCVYSLSITWSKEKVSETARHSWETTIAHDPRECWFVQNSVACLKTVLSSLVVLHWSRNFIICRATLSNHKRNKKCDKMTTGKIRNDLETHETEGISTSACFGLFTKPTFGQHGSLLGENELYF